MAASSWSAQALALTKKNLLLLKRRKRQTLAQVGMHSSEWMSFRSTISSQAFASTTMLIFGLKQLLIPLYMAGVTCLINLAVTVRPSIGPGTKPVKPRLHIPSHACCLLAFPHTGIMAYTPLDVEASCCQ